MNPSTVPLPKPPLMDKALAEQARPGPSRPGHGVPSQDTNPAAQQALDPEEAEREANSVPAGGGVMVCTAAGAAIGVVLAVAVGAVVACTAGAVLGALGGVAAGPLVNSKRPDVAQDATVEKSSTGH